MFSTLECFFQCYNLLFGRFSWCSCCCWCACDLLTFVCCVPFISLSTKNITATNKLANEREARERPTHGHTHFNDTNERKKIIYDIDSYGLIFTIDTHTHMNIMKINSSRKKNAFWLCRNWQPHFDQSNARFSCHLHHITN